MSGEDVYIRGELQLAREHAFRVVVATDHEDRDPGIVEALHLADQEGGRLHAAHIAIVEITGDQEGVDVFFEAEIDNALKGTVRTKLA